MPARGRGHEQVKSDGDHRYKPGMVSLAQEVLMDAIRSGVDPHTLQKSIWAEFLLYHRKLMIGGTK
jgi:hypothetical protein